MYASTCACLYAPPLSAFDFLSGGASAESSAFVLAGAGAAAGAGAGAGAGAAGAGAGAGAGVDAGVAFFVSKYVLGFTFKKRNCEYNKKN